MSLEKLLQCLIVLTVQTLFLLSSLCNSLLFVIHFVRSYLPKIEINTMQTIAYVAET